MHLAATIVSPVLDEALVAKAEIALPGARLDWLSEGRALDLRFDGGHPETIEAILRQTFAADPVDLIVQVHESRRKRLLVADMDSTMIGQECIDELADELGLKPRIAAITERAMRGEIAFEPALRERVALLKGLPVTVIDKLLAERITFTPGGRDLVMTMRAHDGYAALVSGGFTLFTGPVSAHLGFDEHRSNRFVIEDGHLAGRVEEPIVGAEAKLSALRDLTVARGISPEETLAVGDGANDLPMLKAAGLGVAFRAKPKVAAEARARVEHTDLTTLLYFQGYRRSDFAG